MANIVFYLCKADLLVLNIVSEGLETMKFTWFKVWNNTKTIFGFGQVLSPLQSRVMQLEINVRWLIRGFWLLLAAIVVRPFFG